MSDPVFPGMVADLDAIHVAFCSDSGMLPGLHAGLSSLFAHQSTHVHLWLYLENCSPGEISKIKKTAALAAGIHLVDLDLSPCLTFRGLHGNHTAYARIFLPGAVSCRRLIYLDSDTLCHADLRPLWEMDLRGHPAAMAPFGNLGSKAEWPIYEKAGLSADASQFNSGVILFDVIRWREKDCTARCLEFGGQNPEKLYTADQTCINGALNKEILPISSEWNIPLNPGTRRVYRGGKEGIYHFVGSPKPWDLFAFLAHMNFKVYFDWLWKSSDPWIFIRQYFKTESYSRLRRLWPAYRERWK
jgi:lipopolysaccharide biosynthesis glycosyltransferase